MTEQANGSNRETARRSKADWLIPPPAVIWILAIALGALLVYVSRDLLLLLFLSAALAYLLNPIVNIAESVLIKRQVAVAAVYLTIGVGMVGAGYFLHPRLSAEIETLTRNLPSFGERLDLAIEPARSGTPPLSRWNYPGVSSNSTPLSMRSSWIPSWAAGRRPWLR